MNQRLEEHAIHVVTACMTHAGTPTFALTTVTVTDEQMENGIHYDLVEAALLEQDFEEPFVHFSELEAPPFLHPAVREQRCQVAR